MVLVSFLIFHLVSFSFRGIIAGLGIGTTDRIGVGRRGRRFSRLEYFSLCVYFFWTWELRTILSLL